MNLLIPWHAVGANASQLEHELQSELGAKHPLKNRRVRAVAARQDCDDVLFVDVVQPNLVAVVHLTYANRPERDPRWPSTTFFSSFEDWLERGMQPDHDDFDS